MFAFVFEESLFAFAIDTPPFEFALLYERKTTRDSRDSTFRVQKCHFLIFFSQNRPANAGDKNALSLRSRFTLRFSLTQSRLPLYTLPRFEL